GTNETLLYYYNDGKGGILTPETPYKGRVSFSDVSEQDSGNYWYRFSKLGVYTISERARLLVQP
ncbi:tyrosine-protein phosphatase non-receptor type substrate 1-like, partial [Clarias magur]